MINFEEWRNISEGDMGAPVVNTLDYKKSLKKGVRGLDNNLLNRAVPFIQSMSDLDPMSKIKLLAHVLKAVGIDPSMLSKMKTNMNR